jgi:hypothetical protein
MHVYAIYPRFSIVYYKFCLGTEQCPWLLCFTAYGYFVKEKFNVMFKTETLNSWLPLVTVEDSALQKSNEVVL